MTQPRECCSSCRFFLETQHGIVGECHRHAPIMAANAQPGIQHQFGRFPLVTVGGWCGDYVPRPVRKAVSRV